MDARAAHLHNKAVAARNMKALRHAGLILHHRDEILPVGRSDGNTDQRVDMAFRLGVAQHYGVACDHARLFHTADALAHSRACQRYLAGDILYRHAAVGRQQAQYFAVQFIHAGQASNGKILMF